MKVADLDLYGSDIVETEMVANPKGDIRCVASAGGEVHASGDGAGALDPVDLVHVHSSVYWCFVVFLSNTARASLLIRAIEGHDACFGAFERLLAHLDGTEPVRIMCINTGARDEACRCASRE